MPTYPDIDNERQQLRLRLQQLDEEEVRRLKTETDAVRAIAATIHGLTCCLSHEADDAASCDWVRTTWDEPGEKRIEHLGYAKSFVPTQGVLPEDAQQAIEWGGAICQLTKRRVYP
jgi:hypothetical protein